MNSEEVKQHQHEVTEKMTQATTEKSQDNKYLIFRVGSEFYAASLDEILEVIEPQEVSNLPESPQHCLGVMNLRGEVVTVYDFAKRIRQTPTDSNHKLLIVINDTRGKAAYLVDQMIEVRGFGGEDIDEEFQMHSDLPESSVIGVSPRGDKVVFLVRLEELNQKSA